jgi:hypothetical protein
VSDPLYEVLKDLVVPGLAGVGGILVGIGALVVAQRSHALAEQVRADEKKRDDAAAAALYRDQLFRTVEPAVTALLDYRVELLASHQVDGAADRAVRSAAIVRLSMLRAVVNEDHLRVVSAATASYYRAMDTQRWDVLWRVLGRMVVLLPLLLDSDPPDDELVAEASSLVEAEVAALANESRASSMEESTPG